MRLERKVEERTFEIQQQKVEIEEKNHEILGSIRYAKRIQEALLPPRQVMDDLFGDYFIYYQPRDIVSGDFYWATSVSTTLKEEKNRRVALLAVADCTGHGVPGAFMSLLGTNFLKQSSGELSVNNPAQALDFLNKNVIATLNQNPGENRVRDGMDIGLIAIDYENMHLQYAGANNPIYIVRNGIMEIIQADSQAIGSVSDEVKNFTNHSYQLQKGDCIYLFTDGYADQFGGTKGKKFMYRQFRELLLRLATLPMSRQCEELDQVFKSWKGKHEQVDDVCVLGIRV